MGAYYLYAFCGAFAAGVALATYGDFGIALPILLYVMAAGVFLFSLLRKFPKHSTYFLLSFSLVAAGLGALRFEAADTLPDPVLSSHVGERVSAEGVIRAEPDFRERSTRYIVLLERVENVEVRGRALVVSDRIPRFEYGDRISIEGDLRVPEAFEDERGEIFNYPAFLQKEGIFFEFFYPETARIGGGEGNAVIAALLSLKSGFMENISRVISEPQSSLLGGLLLGAKHSLGESLMEKFRETGIVHIVVLSGYNLTIVALFIMWGLRFLPERVGILVGIFAIILFAVMVGLGATVLRASAMAILALIARATGRTYAITRALFIAGFLMILHNPQILAHDVSFQLSFMATLGLVWLSPMVEKYFLFVPTAWKLREVATATIATQIFVLPILLYQMGDLSLVSLPVNLLVLPVIPLTMLAGFLTGAAGFVSSILSLPFAYASHALLSYVLFIVDLFAAIPFASVSIPLFPLVFLAASYAGLLFWVWRKRKAVFNPKEAKAL